MEVSRYVLVCDEMCFAHIATQSQLLRLTGKAVMRLKHLEIKLSCRELVEDGLENISSLRPSLDIFLLIFSQPNTSQVLLILCISYKKELYVILTAKTSGGKYGLVKALFQKITE